MMPSSSTHVTRSRRRVVARAARRPQRAALAVGRRHEDLAVVAREARRAEAHLELDRTPPLPTAAGSSTLTGLLDVDRVLHLARPPRTTTPLRRIPRADGDQLHRAVLLQLEVADVVRRALAIAVACRTTPGRSTPVMLVNFSSSVMLAALRNASLLLFLLEHARNGVRVRVHAVPRERREQSSAWCRGPRRRTARRSAWRQRSSSSVKLATAAGRRLRAEHAGGQAVRGGARARPARWR
jgi:hypothetical protein